MLHVCSSNNNKKPYGENIKSHKKPIELTLLKTATTAERNFPFPVHVNRAPLFNVIYQTNKPSEFCHYVTPPYLRASPPFMTALKQSWQISQAANSSKRHHFSIANTRCSTSRIRRPRVMQCPNDVMFGNAHFTSSFVRPRGLRGNLFPSQAVTGGEAVSVLRFVFPV